MARAILATILLFAPLAASAADEFRISQLDQDIQELRRQVQEQQRQIEALRSRQPQPAAPVVRPSTGTATVSHDWVDASKWQKIRAGMSELEVITVLGRPTSMRATDTERVLLYAMEIGSSGFLGGSVTFRDRVVVEVQTPVLK